MVQEVYQEIYLIVLFWWIDILETLYWFLNYLLKLVNSLKTNIIGTDHNFWYFLEWHQIYFFVADFDLLSWEIDNFTFVIR